MPDDRVEVQIIADSSSYQAGTKAAAQATDQLRVSAGQMAEALKQAGGDLSKINPALLGISTAAKEATASINTTAPAAKAATAEISGAAKAATEASGAMDKLRFGTSGAIQEIVRLGRALATGRLDMIPGELATLASRTGGLQAAFAGLTPEVGLALGAVLGLDAAMIALAVHTDRAAAALDKARDAFAMNGIKTSDDQLAALMEQLKRVPDVGDDAAAKIQTIFANMAGSTFEASMAMARALPTAMAKGGVDAVEAARTMASEWAKTVADSPAPQLAATQFFDKFTKSAEQGAAASKPAMMRALTEATGMGVAGMQQIGPIFDQATTTQTEGDAKAISAAIDSVTVSLKGAQTAADTQTKALQGNFQLDMALAEEGKQQAKDAISAAREADQQREQAGRTAIAQAREQASEIASNEKLSAEQRLGFEAQLWGQLRDGERITGSQKIEINTELNSVLAELNRQRAEDAKRAAEQIAQSDAAVLRYEIDSAKQILEENKRDSEQTARAWNEALNSVDSSVKTFLSDVISRHETAAQAGKAAIAKLVTSWISGIAEIMLKIAAFEALRAASGLGGAIGGIAASGASALGTSLTASLGPSLARMLGTVGGSQLPNSTSDPGAQSIEQLTSAVAENTSATTSNTGGLLNVVSSLASKVVGSLVGSATGAATEATTVTTPIVTAVTAGSGSVVAAIGAQMAAEVPLLSAIALKPSVLGTSYAVGTASVPHDMLAMVHKGEIVIPADISASLRNPQSMTVMGASAGGSVGGGAAPTGASGAAGGTTHNWNISAIDGPGVAAFFGRNMNLIARTVAGANALTPSITAPSY